ncbi:MAG: acetolactate synthase [Oscillospiraceae bacterium]|nr:acetolactate synthase [Oscillospiraceae bacterium]
MAVKQISVFVENKPGKLAELTNVLHQHEIDMRALSIAEAEDFGVVRIIVNDSYNTACVLKDAGYILSVTPVLAASIDDKPGALDAILDILGEADINLEYIYAFLGRVQGKAYMVMRVSDCEKAADVLTKKGIRLYDQTDLENL